MINNYFHNIETVEQCLTSIPGVMLSVKSIAKKTGLRTKQVTYICHHSKVLRQIEPLEIGSLKTQLNVFTAL